MDKNIMERILGVEIKVAVFTRLYGLFCEACHCTQFDECEYFQRVQCSKCGNLHAYRLRPEDETALIEYSMLGEGELVQ
jgi:hypothetical protein